jgi:formamidopyrimidine-DNA glycosylase
MPELPEVETVVRDLRPLLVGRTIRGVTAGRQRLRTPWKAAWTGRLAGATVAAVGRRGKWIILDLGTPRLLVHLGMTGQFTVAAAADPLADHTHLVFALDDGRHLRFRDVRRFGSAALFDTAAALDAFLAGRLGPEPFGLDPGYFRAAVRASARSLKAVLLDQTVVAGVGNIYADEACFRAGLHPARRGASLSPADADRLREAIEVVLTKAIAGRGSTIRDYVGGSGRAGSYQAAHAVYGRTGRPCPRCDTPVACVRLAGRSSHFCPSCQLSAFSRQPDKAAPRTRTHRPRRPDRLTAES